MGAQIIPYSDGTYRLVEGNRSLMSFDSVTTMLQAAHAIDDYVQRKTKPKPIYVGPPDQFRDSTNMITKQGLYAKQEAAWKRVHDLEHSPKNFHLICPWCQIDRKAAEKKEAAA